MILLVEHFIYIYIYFFFFFFFENQDKTFLLRQAIQVSLKD